LTEEKYNAPDRNTLEYIAWRNAVFARDNYTCQKCGATYKPPSEKYITTKGGVRLKVDKGNTIHAHHKKQFALHPELATDIINGITLCEACHRSTYKNMKRPGNPINTVSMKMDRESADELKKHSRDAGLTVSQFCILSAYYLSREIKAGRLVMTKAGLFPGR